MDFEAITRHVFDKLGKEKTIRQYQDIVRKLIGVPIDFINTNNISMMLSEGDPCNPFCRKIKESRLGSIRCHHCDWIRTAAHSQKTEVYTCHAGLIDVILPLFSLDRHYIGSLTTGQFLLSDHPRPSEKDMRALAVSLRLSFDELLELHRQSPVLTRLQMEGLIEYLTIIGKHIVSTQDHLMFMEKINTPDKVSSIKEYIGNNYRKDLTVRSIARKFYLSPNYFSVFFHKEVGVTFCSYLNILRINKAKEILEDSDLPVSEVAFLAGFKSISQFNRLFLDIVKCNPRTFRRDIRSRKTPPPAE